MICASVPFDALPTVSAASQVIWHPACAILWYRVYELESMLCAADGKTCKRITPPKYPDSAGDAEGEEGADEEESAEELEDFDADEQQDVNAVEDENEAEDLDGLEDAGEVDGALVSLYSKSNPVFLSTNNWASWGLISTTRSFAVSRGSPPMCAS